MEQTNRIEIDACGVKLRVVTTETKEYIEEIAAYLDNIYKKQCEKKPVQGVDAAQRIVMAAISLTDEFFQYKTEQKELSDEAERRILSLVDELAAQKQYAEEAANALAAARKEFERETRNVSSIKKELDATKKQLASVTKEFQEYIENFK